MNALSYIFADRSEPAGPTLEEQLRYVDLTFDSAIKAKRQLVAEGVISDFGSPFGSDENRKGKVAERAGGIIARAVRQEGLHPDVTRPWVRNHYDAMFDDCGDEIRPVRVPYGMGGRA